ncbi:MAG: hypothetical protein NTX03_11580 [Bacteroidetes bacterium]|nr:hypothetical protein [Bacteroidota bacterium]
MTLGRATKSLILYIVLAFLFISGCKKEDIIVGKLAGSYTITKARLDTMINGKFTGKVYEIDTMGTFALIDNGLGDINRVNKDGIKVFPFGWVLGNVSNQGQEMAWYADYESTKTLSFRSKLGYFGEAAATYTIQSRSLKKMTLTFIAFYKKNYYKETLYLTKD